MGGNGIDQIILHWRSLLRELIYTLPQAASCSSVVFSWDQVKLFTRDSLVSFLSSTLLPFCSNWKSHYWWCLFTFRVFPRPSASCPVWGYRMASGVMVSLTTAALLVLQSSCDSRCPSKLADIWESMVAFISWNIWLDLRVRMDQGPWMLLQSLWQNKNIKSSSHFIIHMYYFTFIQIAILFLRRSWEDLAAT